MLQGLRAWLRSTPLQGQRQAHRGAGTALSGVYCIAGSAYVRTRRHARLEGLGCNMPSVAGLLTTRRGEVLCEGQESVGGGRLPSYCSSVTLYCAGEEGCAQGVCGLPQLPVAPRESPRRAADVQAQVGLEWQL